MEILLIQVKRNRGKEEIEGNKSEDIETRRAVILRPDIKYWDRMGIVAHTFNPALGETEAGVSLCV